MNFFLKNSAEKSEIFNNLRESYSRWKENIREMNKPFFAIHTDFEHQFLNEISGGALKLYLYLGFRSKYQTGESWESIENMANFFKKDQRTVANWLKELEDKNLIYRAQTGFNRKANTFLLPYGFLIEEIDTGDFSETKHIEIDLKTSKSLGYVPQIGLLLNYGFKEYTLVLINKKDQTYICSTFFNFMDSQIENLRKTLKEMNLFLDNYDIDKSLSKLPNRKSIVYGYILKYLSEES